MRARFFGQYLLANGLVTGPQLLAAVEYQDRNNARLGEFAVRLGLATQFEVEQVLALQAKEDRLFGEAAIKLDVLTDDQVQQLLAAQKDRHVRLGDALVELDVLDKLQVDQALAEFFDAEDRIEPEVVTIPDDLPGRDFAFELFYLAHKLLLRVCDLVSKTEKLRIAEGSTPNIDRSVRVPLSGAYMGYLFLSIPNEIAEDTAGRFSGEEEPNQDDVDSVVLELGTLLAGNLASVLAERGLRVEVAPPELLDQGIALGPGEKVALVPFLTHRGQVLVGMRLP